MVGGCWYYFVGVVACCLNDGVVPLVVIVFNDIYCDLDEVVNCEVSPTLFLEFFWEVSSLFSDFFGSVWIDGALHVFRIVVEM